MALTLLFLSPAAFAQMGMAPEAYGYRLHHRPVVLVARSRVNTESDFVDIKTKGPDVALLSQKIDSCLRQVQSWDFESTVRNLGRCDFRVGTGVLLYPYSYDHKALSQTERNELTKADLLSTRIKNAEVFVLEFMIVHDDKAAELRAKIVGLLNAPKSALAQEHVNEAVKEFGALPGDYYRVTFTHRLGLTQVFKVEQGHAMLSKVFVGDGETGPMGETLHLVFGSSTADAGPLLDGHLVPHLATAQGI